MQIKSLISGSLALYLSLTDLALVAVARATPEVTEVKEVGQAGVSAAPEELSLASGVLGAGGQSVAHSHAARWVDSLDNKTSQVNFTGARRVDSLDNKTSQVNFIGARWVESLDNKTSQVNFIGARRVDSLDNKTSQVNFIGARWVDSLDNKTSRQFYSIRPNTLWEHMK
jgi:hypothetical protein